MSSSKRARRRRYRRTQEAFRKAARRFPQTAAKWIKTFSAALLDLQGGFELATRFFREHETNLDRLLRLQVVTRFDPPPAGFVHLVDPVNPPESREPPAPGKSV